MKSLKHFLTQKKFPFGKSLLITIVLLILVKGIHYTLNRTTAEDVRPDSRKEEFIARRAFLVNQLNQGKYHVSAMPEVGVPFQHEWALVSSSMTAIALANMAFTYPETREESLEALEILAEHVISEEYRELGQYTWKRDPLAHLDYLPAQAWYMAHAGYVLSAYKYLGGDGRYDSLYTAMHESVFRTIRESSSPYIETYPDETYTADNAALYASLKLYDQLNGNKNSDLFEYWVKYTKAYTLDPQTGIIKSYVTNRESPYVNSRGSWTGWNSFFLPVIDSTFAAEQYKLSKKHLFDTKLGFRIFREFPHGVNARGDVDSGPVIFGGSTSGTAFIIGGAVWHRDYETVSALLNTSEFVGTSLGTSRRHYLLAPLVGDAIMLAMQTARSWDDRYLAAPYGGE